MLEIFKSYLKEKDVEYKENFPLSKLSSVKIGGVCALVVYPDCKDKLVLILRYLVGKEIRFVVVGRMTNILPKDSYFEGVVVNTSKISGKYRAENIVYADCGALLSPIIREMAALGYGGACGLCGIPGTVGGAVSGNAGAFGSEMSDIFCRGEFLSLDTLCTESYCKEELHFSYRHSAIPDKRLVLLSCSLKFHPGNSDEILYSIGRFDIKRRTSQPTGCFSLGSVFKRVGGVGAGYYIDKAGLKGYRVGGAEVSCKHAGFVVNTGGASADDFLKLIKYVKYRVYSEFGILLEEEIKVI